MITGFGLCGGGRCRCAEKCNWCSRYVGAVYRTSCSVHAKTSMWPSIQQTRKTKYISSCTNLQTRI